VLVSFVYLVACRLFALVLLLARGDRADRRRATQARDFGLGDAGTERARPCRHAAGTGARRFELAIVPAPTPRHDPRLRLLHCRHGLAAAAVRAVLLAQPTANQGS